VDYQTLPTTLVIPAGAASANLVVQPIEDAQVEAAETVDAAIAASSAYTLGTVSGSVTIADNDVAGAEPVVSVAAQVRFTIESGNVKAVFRVQRSGSTKSELKVQLDIGGSATNGKDYERLAQKVTIPGGRAYVDITIDPIRDRTTEPVETIIISIDPQPKYTVGTPRQATAYLFDYEAARAFLERQRDDD
jgi:hypothetical protein